MSTESPPNQPSNDLLNGTTTSKTNLVLKVTEASAAMALDPLSHVGDGVFLQTKTAQVLAGVFVWIALFITCQQVRILIN
jgi:hypothetical protein